MGKKPEPLTTLAVPGKIVGSPPEQFKVETPAHFRDALNASEVSDEIGVKLVGVLSNLSDLAILSKDSRHRMRARVAAQLLVARKQDNTAVITRDILIFRCLHNESYHRATDVSGAFAPHACLFAMANNNVPPENIFIIADQKTTGTEVIKDGKGHDVKRAVFEKILPKKVVAKKVQEVFEYWEKQVGKDPKLRLRAVAFFCHGISGSMQLGFASNNPAYGDISKLAELIKRTSKEDVRVALYCCLTGASKSENDWDDLKHLEADWKAWEKKKAKQISDWEESHSTWKEKKEQWEKEQRKDTFKDPEPQKPQPPKEPKKPRPGRITPPPKTERHGDRSFAWALRDELVKQFGFNSKGEANFKGHVDAHACLGHSVMNRYIRRFSAPAGANGEWLVDPGYYYPDEPAEKDKSKIKRWNVWTWAMYHNKGPGSVLAWRFPLMEAKDIHKWLDTYKEKEGISHDFMTGYE